MYLEYTKGVLTNGLIQVFGPNFRIVDFRNVLVSMEYPVRAQDYPSIWVDFEPIGVVRNVGIGQVEGIPTAAATLLGRYRWAFAGTASFTVVAMTSRERDRLFDALISVIAFSQLDANQSQFRQYVENNPYIGMNMNFDSIDQRGFNVGQGTPWGTDEMIYEATIAGDIEGEFIATAGQEFGLVKLIETITWTSGEAVPTEASGWDQPNSTPHPAYIS